MPSQLGVCDAHPQIWLSHESRGDAFSLQSHLPFKRPWPPHLLKESKADLRSVPGAPLGEREFKHH